MVVLLFSVELLIYTLFLLIMLGYYLIYVYILNAWHFIGFAIKDW